MNTLRIGSVFALLPALILASVLLLPGKGGAAEMVVVTSEIPGMPPGKVIPDGERLEIPKGKKVFFISGSGVPVALEGPFSGIPAAGAAKGDSGLAPAISEIITSGKAKEVTGGNSRAAAARSTDVSRPLWQIDASVSGISCLVWDKVIKVWRPGTKAGTLIEVKDSATSDTAALTWPGNGDTAGWHAGFPLEEGAKYLFRVDGEKDSVAVEIRFLDNLKGALGEQVLMLAEKGCRDQALGLLMSAN